MNLGLSFAYPTWYIIFCILIGCLISGFLYFKNHQFLENKPTGKYLIYLLSFIRFLGITILAFLLLSPLLKIKKTVIEKPSIVLLHDNSASIKNHFTIQDSSTYAKQLKLFTDKFDEKYRVDYYSFGDSLSKNKAYTFSDNQTDIATALYELDNVYENQNIGAVIVATDGIYNRGSNPLYALPNITAPVYFIALGDTTKKFDLKIKNVTYNDIAYLGDKIAVKVDVQAINAINTSSKLILQKITAEGDTRPVISEDYIIDTDDYFKSFLLIIDANTKGINHYRLTIPAMKKEANTENNTEDIFIEVLDGKQKILILANAPHPDLKAFKSSIESNKNYQADVKMIGNLNDNLQIYDLIILYELPAKNNAAQSIHQTLQDNNVSILYVVGEQSNTTLLNSYQNIIKFNVQNTH